MSSEGARLAFLKASDLEDEVCCNSADGRLGCGTGVEEVLMARGGSGAGRSFLLRCRNRSMSDRLPPEFDSDLSLLMGPIGAVEARWTKVFIGVCKVLRREAAKASCGDPDDVGCLSSMDGLEAEESLILDVRLR